MSQRDQPKQDKQKITRPERTKGPRHQAENARQRGPGGGYEQLRRSPTQPLEDGPGVAQRLIDPNPPRDPREIERRPPGELASAVPTEADDRR